MDETKYLNFLYELHKDNPRQGPGTPESTLKALAMLPPFLEGHHILDVGCGTGASTRVLWQQTTSHITAVDFFPGFLRRLDEKIARDGVQSRVTTLEGDMAALPFDPGGFDLIWSEGAIFIMGFENGLEAWHPLLKPGGYIAVSDAAWIKENPPKPCFDYWQAAYDGIAPVDEMLERVVRAGYEPIGHFTLPKAAWTEHYYASLKQALPGFEKACGDDPTARHVIEETHTEIALFDEYGDYYNYEFFIAERR